MTNLLILLGSRYLNIHEYDLPRGISDRSTDPTEPTQWIVYSIDILSSSSLTIEEKAEEDHFADIKVIRLQMSIESIYPEMFGSRYHTIYIMDSISCGFVTETSFKLIDYFLKYSSRIYWTHYISPYNEYPTIPLSSYTRSEIHFLLDTILTPLPEKAVRHLYQSFLVSRNIAEFILNLPQSILTKNKTDIILFAQSYLTMRDLNYIEFYLVHEENISELYKINISCIATNTYHL